MKQDSELDQLFRASSKENFDEEIPYVFLSDLNERLDSHQKKRKKPLAIWWFTGILIFSFLTWGATQFFEHKGENQVFSKNKTNSRELVKSTSVNSGKNEKLTNVTKEKPTNENNYIESQSVENELETTTKKTISKTNKFDLTKKNISSRLIASFPSDVKTQDLSTIIYLKTTETEFKNQSETSSSIEEPQDLSISKDSVSDLKSINLNNTNADKTKKLLQKEIGFFTGVSGILSSFEIPQQLANSISSASFNEYREKREREEVSTTSWDLALRMKFVFKNISFQSGFDYFQWGEQIRYNYNSISGINRYSYINIPLNIGYSKTWNQFGINPFAGASMGFGFQRNGMYLNTDLVSLTEVESKKIIGNYQFGCELSYLSKSNFKLSIIPTYRASFGDVIFTDLIRNRYQSIGLQMGISFFW